MRVRDQFKRVETHLWCKLFGHVITGYGGCIPYLRPAPNWANSDGLNIYHIPLYGRCDECGQDILVAMMHSSKGDPHAI